MKFDSMEGFGEKAKKYAKTALVAGISLATPHHTEGQTLVAPWSPKPMTKEAFTKLAQEKPFDFIHYVDSADISQTKDGLKIAENSLMTENPGLLVEILAKHKNDSEIYDEKLLLKALFATAAQDPATVLRNAAVLADFTEGKDILDSALHTAVNDEFKQFLLLDKRAFAMYASLPYAQEIREKYLRAAVDKLMEKHDWNEIMASAEEFTDRPWAEAVFIKAEKEVPEMISWAGGGLMEKEFGRKMLIRVLEKNPESVSTLNLGTAALSPELDSVITNAIRHMENVGESYSYLLARPWIFAKVTEGPALLKELTEKMAPEEVVYRLEMNYIHDSGIKQEVLKEILKSAVTRSEFPEGIMHFASLFSSELYGYSVIQKAAERNPVSILENAMFLIPLEKYKSLIHQTILNQIEQNPAAVFLHPDAIRLSARDSLEYEERLEMAARATVFEKKHYRNFAKNFRTIEGRSYAPDLLYQAALDMPVITTMIEPTYSPLLEKRRESDPYIKTIFAIRDIVTHKGTVLLENPNDIFGATQYITENKISEDMIASTFSDKENLFRAYLYTLRSENPVGLNQVQTSLAKLASRTVQEINSRHNEPDSVRFASANTMAADGLYLLSTYGENEVFTSTFNGLFNRMIAQLDSSGQNGRDFLASLQFDHARTFIRECASYNRLNDFLKTMPTDAQEKLLTWFVEQIDADKEIVQAGVTIADVISSVDDPNILKTFGASIEKRYREAGGDSKLQTTYGLLGSLYSKKSVEKDSLFTRLSTEYPIESFAELSRKSISNPDGTTVERYFFYNDPGGNVNDGQASYQSFLAQYKNDAEWHVEEQENYTIIRSLLGSPVVMFANQPSAEDEGNKEIDSVLAARKQTVNVVVHRGHSYHAESTINRIPSSAKFVSLGSCGGYRNLEGVLKHAPEAHVLSTKGTGTMQVNDPILKSLNEELRKGRDLHWQELWAGFEQKLGGDPRFKDYVPPHENLSFMFIQAYNKISKQKAGEGSK